jgi:hypothetical protein
VSAAIVRSGRSTTRCRAGLFDDRSQAVPEELRILVVDRDDDRDDLVVNVIVGVVIA